MPQDQPISIRVGPKAISFGLYHRERQMRPFIVSMPRAEFEALCAFVASVPVHCHSSGFLGFTPEQLQLHGLDAVELTPSAER
jgi:hypothetical protein